MHTSEQWQNFRVNRNAIKASSVHGLCLVKGTDCNQDLEDEASIADIILVELALCSHQSLICLI